MTLKNLKNIISEIRYSKYDGKKAIGYDYYKIQEELKKEAINWVKHLRSKPKRQQTEYQAQILMEFFNITEEDLKDKGPIIKRYEDLDHLKYFNEDGTKK